MEVFENILFLVVSFGIPAWLVVRLRAVGIPLGALAMWGLVHLSSEVQYARHPEWRGIGSGVWLVTGWLVGLSYCLIVWILVRLYIYVKAKRRQ
jgi:hypothetical protein